MKIFRKKNVTNVEVHLIKNTFKKVYKCFLTVKDFICKRSVRTTG